MRTKESCASPGDQARAREESHWGGGDSPVNLPCLCVLAQGHLGRLYATVLLGKPVAAATAAAVAALSPPALRAARPPSLVEDIDRAGKGPLAKLFVHRVVHPAHPHAETFARVRRDGALLQRVAHSRRAVRARVQARQGADEGFGVLPLRIGRLVWVVRGHRVELVGMGRGDVVWMEELDVGEEQRSSRVAMCELW